jgi:tetratricopeptide (TPR) repeat protein
MNLQTPLEPDDRFAALLGGVDEALAQGQMPPRALVDNEEPELTARLARGRRCVELLARLRPSRRAFAAQETPAGGDTNRGIGTELLPVLLPTTLGRFEIRQELGRGGFGIVYLAHDPVLKREVALKVPRFSVLADPELKQRFSREAQAGAGLEHPNIAAVYDAGEVAGVSYIASAYCPGITLAHWLRQQEQPVAATQAAALVACLADAVQHGHSRGILHRDLKPGNVILVEASQGERGLQSDAQPHCCRLGNAWYCPKVTDFGLARRIEEVGQTREGAALGTPGYMAPEQARSGAGESTPATDVYGLGAILYELLVGRAPFIGESPLDILDQVRHQEVVPPRRLRPRLPRDLETICLKCLAKDPHERYESAALLADDLRRFLAGEPILARPVGRTERVMRWCRRNPAVATLGGGIVLLLVCSTAVATTLAVWALNEREQAGKNARLELAARELAEYRFTQAEKAVAYLEGIEANERLKQADFFDLRKQLLTSAIPFYEEFVQHKPGDANLEAKRGRAYLRLASLRRWIGDRKQAITGFEQARAIFQKLAADFPGAAEYRLELARAHRGLGLVLNELGNRNEAEAEHRLALALLQALRAEAPADRTYRNELAGIHLSLGTVHRAMGNREDAAKANRRAIELRQSLVAEFPDVAEYRWALARSYNNLAAVFHGRRDSSEVVPLYRQSISLHRSLASEFPQVADYRYSLAQTHLNLAGLLAKQQDQSEAREHYNEALRLARQLVNDFPSMPPFRSLLGMIRYDLAIGLAANGKPEDAKAEFRTVLQIQTQLVEEFPDVIDYRHGLANTLHHLAALTVNDGALEEARRMIELAIEHQLKAFQAVPTNQGYAGGLRKHYHGLGDLTLKQADHAATAEAANRLAQVHPHSADDAQYAARFFGRCITLAERDAKLFEDQRAALAQTYAEKAMEHLHQAVRLGYANVRLFRELESLAPLRARPDFQQLVGKPHRVDGALEGEQLGVLRLTAGTATAQSMVLRFMAGEWSGDQQLWWRGGRPGDRLDVAIDVSTAGTYDLEIVLTKARDYGVVQLWLEGVKLGDPVDLFHATGVVTTGVLSHRGLTLSSGSHVLSIEIVGANPAATKEYMFGLDYIRLVSSALVDN